MPGSREALRCESRFGVTGKTVLRKHTSRANCDAALRRCEPLCASAHHEVVHVSKHVMLRLSDAYLLKAVKWCKAVPTGCCQFVFAEHSWNMAIGCLHGHMAIWPYSMASMALWPLASTGRALGLLLEVLTYSGEISTFERKAKACNMHGLSCHSNRGGSGVVCIRCSLDKG